MAGPCPADFARLAAAVGGFTCQQGRPFIQLRDPFRLANWTLPVLEALIVTCAVLALVHAIGRHRRHADPTALAIWLATVAYLAVIEPPVYFPGLAGQETVDFAHNVFTVELLWDRLPLYIVALYPAVTVLAYEIVRALGRGMHARRRLARARRKARPRASRHHVGQRRLVRHGPRGAVGKLTAGVLQRRRRRHQRRHPDRQPALRGDVPGPLRAPARSRQATQRRLRHPTSASPPPGHPTARSPHRRPRPT